MPIDELPLDQWKAALDTNLTGESKRESKRQLALYRVKGSCG